MVNEKFEVFYDGDCPLCVREINFLRRRDAKRSRISFTDISAPNFDASSFGMTQQDFMAQIRGRLPSGEFVVGVDVFRELYSAVGFGWAVHATRTPGISWILDRAYSWFAKNRLRITGRCESDACQIPAANDNRVQAA